ncbi:MAG TPA: hypothetical protein VHO29_20345 [Marmoricola sp.]|nr:hypothetical protein [Marmoricola sp.]
MLALVFVFLTIGLLATAAAGRPMSMIDEHIHLDTQFKVHDHTFPHRGSLLGPELVHEWACGVGHEAGPTTVPCGSPDLGPGSIPSGKYTSGYIHYPTWFIGGEVFRAGYTAVFGARRPIDIYRQYAAVVMLAGVACCAVASWRMGLRGSALMAGTFTPVAASSILMFGTQVNPNSAAVLCGALIGGAGLSWVRTGRGFWKLALGTAFASVVSIISTLPVGAFLILMTTVLLLGRRNWTLPGPWQPRWSQVFALGALVLVPVYVWGRVTSAQATVSNKTLYGFFAIKQPSDVAVGAVRELFTLHDPWTEGDVLNAPAGHVVLGLLRAPAYGVPFLVSVIVLGTLLWVAVERHLACRSRTPSVPDAAGTSAESTTAVGGRPAAKTLPVAQMAVWSALAALILYPPALRIWLALSAGFEHGVVSRYSIAFTPLLTWLALDTLRDSRRMTRVLAAVAVTGVVALAAVGY